MSGGSQTNLTWLLNKILYAELTCSMYVMINFIKHSKTKLYVVWMCVYNSCSLMDARYYNDILPLDAPFRTRQDLSVRLQITSHGPRMTVRMPAAFNNNSGTGPTASYVSTCFISLWLTKLAQSFLRFLALSCILFFHL